MNSHHRQLQLTMVLSLTVAAIPTAAVACEPIIPLTHLMTGANAVGPVLLLDSLTWLFVAVGIKMTAFALLERRLPWKQALAFMLLANVLSTVPGVLAAAFAGSLDLLSLPIIFGLGKLAEKRLAAFSAELGPRWFTGTAFAPIFTAAFGVSVVMFYMAGTALEGGDFTSYWILKLLFATTAVTIGMAISTVLEECAVARLSRKQYGRLSFYTSVARANYITLGLVLSVAASQMVPKRLSAPHFIVSWIHAVTSALGLA